MLTGTKKKLLDLIKLHGELAVDESVEEMDLAKTTLREHFMQLERAHYIERSYDRAGRGRPSLKFQLTQKGHDVYPSHEPRMMRELIQYLQEKGKQELMEGFFKKYWDDRYRKFKHKLEEAKVESEARKAAIVQEMLDEEGFMPVAQHIESGTLTIKECNCPFREIIKATTLPCKLEKEFYQKIFGQDVERTTYIAEGDSACTYCIG
jgi:predicted ArsR family transcriptional regulator